MDRRVGVGPADVDEIVAAQRPQIVHAHRAVGLGKGVELAFDAIRDQTVIADRRFGPRAAAVVLDRLDTFQRGHAKTLANGVERLDGIDQRSLLVGLHAGAALGQVRHAHREQNAIDDPALLAAATQDKNAAGRIDREALKRLAQAHLHAPTAVAAARVFFGHAIGHPRDHLQRKRSHRFGAAP